MVLEIKRTGKSMIIHDPNFMPVLSFIQDNSGFQPITRENGVRFESRNVEINKTGKITEIKISLEMGDHIYGLGEKPGKIERKRSIHSVYSKDAWNYNRKLEEIYSSFPSFIIVSAGILEVLVNSGSEITFDFGVSDYNSITIRIPEEDFEFFMGSADSFDEIMEWHSLLTGKPFRLPGWVLGHQVSRWSYYPEKIVEQIRDSYLMEFPLSAIYLDIDYMQGYRIFTWSREKFPEPEKFVRESLDRGVRIIPIIDPGIKMDQNFSILRKFMGHLVEDGDGGIFTGYVWPGLCAFPDFLNSETRRIWSEEIKKFSSIGIEGIWLDMNEPSVKTVKGKTTESETINGEALHRLDDGTVRRHSQVHNFYPYFQAMATHDALKDNVKEPFVLTRSGYTGIQKYAAMWTGDNESSYDDLLLQMTMVMSLGISGMPYAGCDLGGFMGYSDHELLCRYYEMALFFPLYRNHKVKEGNDQELFNIPEKYKTRIKSAIETRMLFMEYLQSVMDESHLTGHPVIRPLFYHYFHDRETLSIDDQYMVGSEIIYAPQVYRDRNTRELYIPEGEWINFNNGEKVQERTWMTSGDRFPIYVKERTYRRIKKLQEN